MMTDHSRNGMQGLINAMELVAPAVDPADPIACEQLQSAMRYLQFLRDRIDLIYDRERFELRHHIDMGENLARATSASLAPRGGDLADRCAAGRALLNTAGANVPELRACTAGIAAAVTVLIRDAADATPEVRTPLERIVLEAAAERIAFERSWYLPLGFDHSPAEVPSIADVIAGERAAQALAGGGAGA